MRKYVISRWSVPFAGFLLTLMGGFSYAWGVFVVPMINKFGWTKAEVLLPFTIFMVVFALVMFPAGKMQNKIGPRKVSMAGAILFFVAYGLAALVSRLPYSWWLVVTYGIIGGTACALTYACVAPPDRKWFPAITPSCFGTKHLGANYGMVFTAFGVGALSPTIGAAIFDATGSYAPIFISAGVMAAAGIILCLIPKNKYAVA